MGGHGGLNILPQKRWNVYNYENRRKVEKDRQKDKEKRQKAESQHLAAQSDIRYEKLRIDSESERIKKPISNLNKEFLNNLQQRSKNGNAPNGLNLFREEQHAVEMREELHAKIAKDKDFFKDKPYDESSKFMGSIESSRDSQPWYLQSSHNISNMQPKKLHSSKVKHEQKEAYTINQDADDVENQIKNVSQGEKQNFYQTIILQNKIHHHQASQNTETQQKVHKNNISKDQQRKEKNNEKQIKRLKKKIKQQKKIIEKQIQLKNMRKEREEREEKERNRAQCLLLHSFKFESN